MDSAMLFVSQAAFTHGNRKIIEYLFDQGADLSLIVGRPMSGDLLSKWRDMVTTTNLRTGLKKLWKTVPSGAQPTVSRSKAAAISALV
jgi:hypothetical protein